MYYFKEGFCWSDINTTFLKCRQKQKSINDVKSMSLYSQCIKTPENYLISLINSTFMSLYVDEFVNNTQTFQINDARQIPIIIPSKKQLSQVNDLFESAFKIKQSQSSNQISNKHEESELKEIQEKIDRIVNEIYNV